MTPIRRGTARCSLATALVLGVIVAPALTAVSACARVAEGGRSDYVPKNYKLVWSDEFNGNEIDGSKWSPRARGPRGGGFYRDDQVWVDGQGHLVVNSEADGDERLLGMTSTQKHFLTKYGYFEARIKMPDMAGKAAGFWLQSPTMRRNDGEPGRWGDEIDIVEYYRGRLGGLADSAIHWGGYGVDRRERQRRYQYRFDDNHDWHVYGLLWTADGYRFYVDGRETWRTSVAVSQVPEYIILSLQIPDNGRVRPAHLFPDSMLVDYVRVYKPRTN